MLIKLKFACNAAVLDIVNNGTETIIFKPEEMIVFVDVRLLCYYKNQARYIATKSKHILQILKRWMHFMNI